MAMSDNKKLDELKKNVRHWHQYFNENFNRYHLCRSFLYKSNLTNDQKNNLGVLQKPAFEFNVLEAYVSRLVGEFSKQEPSFTVHPNPDSAYIDPRIPTVLEGHLAAMLYESKQDAVEIETYKDQLSGGFSVLKVYADYESDQSFNQKIFIRRAYDPTMCGFDLLARQPHKGDGDYCFEIFPMKREQFKKKYPEVSLDQVQYLTLTDFNWAYKYANEHIILVCEYYEKVKRRKRLVYLTNNQSMLKDDYNAMLKKYEEDNRIEQPPQVVKERTTEVTVIKRYVFIQNQIISEDETQYDKLPLIFVDGNSFYLREGGDNSDVVQFCRPYFFHAMDAQKLKNLAGQSLANELENMVMHKFIVPKEGIPENYQEAYKNVQKASTLVFNAFKEDGITPIPPPREVQRPPIPPEVSNSFAMADQCIQGILGSYDASLGINDNQLAGVAIVEAATQSNAAAMPYVTNFLTSWNQVAQIILDLIPKIYFNPRAIMTLDKQRKKTYQGINGFGQDSINLNYEPSALNVMVEAGVNFEVQKNRSIQMLAMLGQTFPAVNQLINTKGLPILFDNLSFRGSDQMKSLAEQMTQQMEQQEAQAQQQAAQGNTPPNPLTLKQQDLQMRAQNQQANIMLEMAKLKNEQQRMQMDYLEMQQDHGVELARNQTERDVHAANIHLDNKDMELKHATNMMKHAHDVMNTMHTIAKDQESSNNEHRNDTSQSEG